VSVADDEPAARDFAQWRATLPGGYRLEPTGQGFLIAITLNGEVLAEVCAPTGIRAYELAEEYVENDRKTRVPEG
jgi:hypothetical protein